MSSEEPHAITRARERFGIELTKIDLREMRQMTRDGRAVLVRDQADGIGRQWLLRIKGVAMIAVLARLSGAVLTVQGLDGKRTAREDGQTVKRERKQHHRKGNKGWRSGGRGKRDLDPYDRSKEPRP